MNKKYIIIIVTLFFFLLFWLLYKFFYSEELNDIKNNNSFKEKIVNDKNKLEFNINSLTWWILESSWDTSL